MGTETHLLDDIHIWMRHQVDKKIIPSMGTETNATKESIIAGAIGR